MSNFNNTLERQLKQNSRLSPEFLILIVGAGGIATLGLLCNSPAVIIGSMIIAPLLSPLIALSFAIVSRNPDMGRQSAWTLVIGSLVGALVAYCAALIVQPNELTHEIIARTQPTWIDLGVACLGGITGAYCHTKRQLHQTLAGVSIAVALMPPLGVFGIGLAQHSLSVSVGGAVLYLINVVGITVSGAFAFFALNRASAGQTKLAPVHAFNRVPQFTEQQVD